MSNDNSDNSNKPVPSTDTKPPKEGNPRPFPVPARRKEDRHKTRIFALLVGINSYEGSITKLHGCVRDVNNVANYLRNRFVDEADRQAVADIEPSASVDQTEVYPKLFLRCLTNAEATYDKVIQAFQEHLSGLRTEGVTTNVPVPTGDDSFWFHFSGHGSEQFTADELLPQVPNGKDQTLVCYNPGGGTNGIFIADKELAFLIDDINTNTRVQKKKPHILVTLDACHSGSGTRDFLEEPGVQTRNFEFLTHKTRSEDGIPDSHFRTLNTYFGNLKPGHLAVPESSHLLMAACTNTEKAGDLGKRDGGVFTSSLIEVLGEYDQADDIPYYELFERARSRARTKRSTQHAQFEAVGNFNTHTTFIEGYRVKDSGKRYKIVPRNGGWSIECGIIHGLPAKADVDEATAAQQAGNQDETMMEVWEGNTLLGFAAVTDVGLQDSKIKLLGGLDLGSTDIENLAENGVAEAKRPFYGKIFSMHAPAAYVWLHGHAATVDQLKAEWNEEENPEEIQLGSLNIIPVDSEDSPGRPAILEVEASTETLPDGTDSPLFTFRSIETGLRWTSSHLATVEEADFIPKAKEKIQKIINWHRFFDLDNPKSKLRDKSGLQFLETDRKTADREGSIPGSMRTHNTTEIKLYRNKDTFYQGAHPTGGYAVDAIFYNLNLINKAENENLFFYLYEFHGTGQIKLLNSDATKREIPGNTTRKVVPETPMPPVIMLASGGDRPKEEEEHLWYKLLVTRQELKKPEQLEQAPFQDTKDTATGFFPAGSADLNDWCSHTIKVTVIRERGNINPTGEVGFTNASVSIQPHTSINVPVSLVGPSGNVRSADPANKLAHFEAAGVSILDLGNEESKRKRSILEFVEAPDITNEELAQNPLQINIQRELEEGEVVQAMAFDGEFIRVVGDTSVNGDRININIDSLPEVTLPDGSDQELDSVFGAQKVDRSLLKALKFAFFKWSSKDEEDDEELAQLEANFFRLSRVEFQEDGSIKRKQSALKAHVLNAQNVLLVIHGIIGDTKTIVEHLPRIVNDQGRSMTDEYDLVLSFDYENLDTPIEQIAQKLEEALAAAGIDANWGQNLTILAHSMGGLVSRCLIERPERAGASFVKHLIMAGTPNQGSPFGDVPNWLHFARTGLEIAANFLPSNISSFGDFFNKLRNKAPANGMDIFNTLEQMRPNSPLLQQLNDPTAAAPNVRYSIIAGNSADYKVDGNKFQRFAEKAQIRIGDLMNDGEDHDIAVSLESINNELSVGANTTTIWASRGQTIAKADMQEVACHHLNYFITPVSMNAIAKIAIP
ncbi:MAG: caspase family protein [Bacteroidota bacterium]